MPNNGRLTACPFYRYEKNNSISCEDTFHSFRWLKQKSDWMDRYCDREWRRCPYAASLLKMYEDMEKGDEMAEEKHKVEALDKELRKVASRLGRAERRLEAKDEEIRKLRQKNRILEERYMTVRKKYEEERNRALWLNDKLLNALPSYEARFCYLMEKYSGGSFDEYEYTEWSRGKEFRLDAVKDDDGEVIAWKSNVRESKDEPINVYADTKEE